MSNLHEIWGLLEHNPLTDIYLVGVVDKDGDSKEFTAMLANIYLEFGTLQLRCTSIDDYYLQMQVTDSKVFDQWWMDDPDLEFAISSIHELYLGEYPMDGHPIIRFRVFADRESNPEIGLVRAAAFYLKHGDVLFLDPWSSFGIQVGNEYHLNTWLSLHIQPDLEFQEHIWELPP